MPREGSGAETVETVELEVPSGGGKRNSITMKSKVDDIKTESHTQKWIVGCAKPEVHLPKRTDTGHKHEDTQTRPTSYFRAAVRGHGFCFPGQSAASHVFSPRKPSFKSVNTARATDCNTRRSYSRPSCCYREKTGELCSTCVPYLEPEWMKHFRRREPESDSDRKTLAMFVRRTMASSMGAKSQRAHQSRSSSSWGYL